MMCSKPQRLPTSNKGSLTGFVMTLAPFWIEDEGSSALVQQHRLKVYPQVEHLLTNITSRNLHGGQVTESISRVFGMIKRMGASRSASCYLNLLFSVCLFVLCDFSSSKLRLNAISHEKCLHAMLRHNSTNEECTYGRGEKGLLPAKQCK